MDTEAVWSVVVGVVSTALVPSLFGWSDLTWWSVVMSATVLATDVVGCPPTIDSLTGVELDCIGGSMSTDVSPIVCSRSVRQESVSSLYSVCLHVFRRDWMMSGMSVCVCVVCVCVCVVCVCVGVCVCVVCGCITSEKTR